MSSEQLQQLQQQAISAVSGNAVAAPLSQISITLIQPDREHWANQQQKLLTAMRLLNQGKTEESRQMLDQLLNDDPENTGILLKRALVHMLENQYTYTLADARRALEIDAQDPQVWTTAIFLISNTQLMMDQKETALQTVEIGLKRAPGNAFLLTQKGEILSELDRNKEAREALILAVKANPLFAQAYALRAFVETKDGLPFRANDFSKKAFALAPESPDVKLTMAKSEAGLTHFEKAKKLVEEVLTFPATSPYHKMDAYLTLGIIDFGQHNWPQFDLDIRQAIAMVPHHSTAYVVGAEMALEGGNLSLARELAQEAQIRFPNEPQVIRLQAKLNHH